MTVKIIKNQRQVSKIRLKKVTMAALGVYFVNGFQVIDRDGNDLTERFK
jgi:hypothetical protein